MQPEQPAGVLAGVRVLELAEWVFVPTVGALLADQGADVVKLEHARRGDPYRSLRTHGHPHGPGVHMTNRGKRSLALDVKAPAGRELFWELVEKSDVLLTSLRPMAADRLGITTEEVRRRNPRIVFARGSGFGRRGPDRDVPGYDLTAFYSRGGLAQALAGPGAGWPSAMPGAIGDRTSAVGLAFAVTSALVKAQRTGVGSVVDVSLLGMATWLMSADVMRAAAGVTEPLDHDRAAKSNPLVNFFPTADGRWLTLCLMESDRYWADLCKLLEVPQLTGDPRFVDHAARARHQAACLEEMDAAFRRRTLAEWRVVLADFDAPWASVQSAEELAQDPQVLANDYVTTIAEAQVPTVRGPATFDETTPPLGRAPEFGEHTEQLLLELGKTWVDIVDLKDAGVIP
jgi:crotonobetainyl-CoA:carnitine CoA-transferase CaiB-like acyl-CoA transferase